MGSHPLIQQRVPNKLVPVLAALRVRQVPPLPPLLVVVACPRLSLRKLHCSNTTPLNLGQNARSTRQGEEASCLCCLLLKVPQLDPAAAPGLAGIAVAHAAALHTGPAARTIPAVARSRSTLVQARLQKTRPRLGGSKAEMLLRTPMGILAASFSPRRVSQ